MSLLSYTAFILAASLGLLIAVYIRRKKSKGKPLVCPMRGNCASVIHSDYSTFFGIPVEVFGIGYYAVIVIGYAALAFVPGLSSPLLSFGLLGLSTVAFMFSLYLVFIQAFALRQFCTWCIGSALLCAGLFFGAIFHPDADLVATLGDYRKLVLSLHMIGMALGLGGALITDIFFFKFLKDYKISEGEADTMNTLSQVIWIGLGILILSGIGLYLPEMARLNASPKFLVKAIVVGVIVINGLFLNLLIAPKLVKITFERKPHPDGMHHIRRIAFALGAISMTSWVSAFVLGSFRSSPLPFGQLLAMYVSLLCIGVIGSQISERKLVRSAPQDFSVN